jgi:hypothetical protein
MSIQKGIKIITKELTFFGSYVCDCNAVLYNQLRETPLKKKKRLSIRCKLVWPILLFFDPSEVQLLFWY